MASLGQICFGQCAEIESPVEQCKSNAITINPLLPEEDATHLRGRCKKLIFAPVASPKRLGVKLHFYEIIDEKLILSMGFFAGKAS